MLDTEVGVTPPSEGKVPNCYSLGTERFTQHLVTEPSCGMLRPVQYQRHGNSHHGHTSPRFIYQLLLDVLVNFIANQSANILYKTINLTLVLMKEFFGFHQDQNKHFPRTKVTTHLPPTKESSDTRDVSYSLSNHAPFGC